MDSANAFVDHAAKPTPQELSAALGATGALWNKLVACLADDHGITVQEWHSYSRKSGWSLRLKLKKRTILYMSPCKGSFRVAFALGDRAVEAARESKLPKSVVKAIEGAPRYAEGTGVRLLVTRVSDLAAIQKLAAIKLAN